MNESILKLTQSYKLPGKKNNPKAGNVNSKRKMTTERFPIECRKTKTKVITLANHNSCKQRNESIRNRSKYMCLTPSAGKRVRRKHDWFWFVFPLVKKVARVLSTDHRA